VEVKLAGLKKIRVTASANVCREKAFEFQEIPYSINYKEFPGPGCESNLSGVVSFQESL
jgi:hypothetical protein